MTTGQISQRDLFVKAAERTISYVRFISFQQLFIEWKDQF